MQGLACPRCKQPLPAGSRLHCAACKVNFPQLSGVPFLWPEPGGALLDWRNRFNMALADLAAQLDACNSARPDLPAGRTRLQHLHTALQNHQQELQDILAPLQPGEALAKETHLALATRLPSHHGVLSYSQQVFRDWCWGEEENNLVANHLHDVLSAAKLPAEPTVLVLGAGAGRLAFDLHRLLGAQVTFALDSNPFLCLLGQRVSRGGQLNLTEFPRAPLHSGDVAVTRTLTRPVEDVQAETLHFVCGDATRPPFADGSFDLLVTPWLLDVIDIAPRKLLPVLHALLAPSGLWLNHGSVAFAGGDPLSRLSAEELAELSAQQGFSVEHTDNRAFPYLQSPASRHHRTETVYTQLARHSGKAKQGKKQRPPHQHLPDWIVKNNVPVPLSPAFQQQITTVRIHAFIMSLIDGKRDINSMARVLEEQRLMPAAEAAQAIRGFLQKMHEEAVAAQGHSK